MNETLEPAVASNDASLTPPVIDEQNIGAVISVNNAVTNKLVKYAIETGLEPTAQQTLAGAFRPVFLKAHAAILNAQGVAESVKDATCVREIKRSRECRLTIRAVRIEGEKIHKSQKESALRFGKAVDGFKNILLAELGPVEEALDAAEKTAERAESARLAELKARREAELLPLLDGSPILADLSALTEQAFVKLLDDHRLLRQAKLDAAAKVEADRLAKEAADRAERERIEAENAILKAEAEATANRLKAERIEREAQAARERAEREAEQKRIEAERAEERRKAEDDLKRLQAERVAAEAKARKEHEAQAAAAAVEQARLKAELQARVDAEAKAKREEEARVKAEQKAAEAAARRAAAAPDKARLEAFLVTLNALPVPTLINLNLKLGIEVRRNDFIGYVERVIADLSPTPDTKLL